MGLHGVGHFVHLHGLPPFGENDLSPNSQMLHHLLNHPAVVRMLDEISEALNSDVRDFPVCSR